MEEEKLESMMKQVELNKVAIIGIDSASQRILQVLKNGLIEKISGIHSIVQDLVKEVNGIKIQYAYRQGMSNGYGSKKGSIEDGSIEMPSRRKTDLSNRPKWQKWTIIIAVATLFVPNIERIIQLFWLLFKGLEMTFEAILKLL